MINLLPPQIKKEHKELKKFKRILILISLFLFFGLFLSLILFLIKNHISQQAMAQKILFEQKEVELKELLGQREFEEIIKQNNLIFTQLKSFYQQQPNLTEIIEKIDKTLPEGIYLTELSLSSQLPEKRIIECRLTGFSPSREKLIEFKENLKQEKNFKEVYFYPGNWLEKVDINFLVNFQIEI